MRRIFGSIIFLAVFATAVQASTCPADEFVQGAARAYISAARSGSPQAFTSAAGRFSDLRQISLFALGQYRRDLPRNRENEYVSRARAFMGRFMAQYGGQFSGGIVDIVSCSQGASGLVVGAKFSSDKTITFRLRGGGGSYRVEDMSVSSIWLVQAMRSKFTGVIADHGGDVTALLDWLGN